jgi:hypothetical protein
MRPPVDHGTLSASVRFNASSSQLFRDEMIVIIAALDT